MRKIGLFLLAPLLGTFGFAPVASATATVTPHTVGNTRYGAIISTATDPTAGDNLTSWVTLYNSHRAQLGGGPIGVRVYSSTSIPIPNETSPTVDDQIMTWVAANHPEEPVTVSFKAYDGTRLTALLTWAQTHAINLTVIYFHEVQDDWGRDQNPAANPTVYENVYAQMRTAIDASPWKAHVTLEKNLMWYWQWFNAPTKGADWHLFVLPKNADGSKADPADRVTWDAYSPVAWTVYATPAQFMKFALAVWNESAVPWGFGEIGALPKTSPGDTAWVNVTQSYADAARTPSLAGSTYAAMPAAQVFKYWDAYYDDEVQTYDLGQNPAAVSMYAPYVETMPLSG